MKYKIELTTMHDVEEFSALVQQVDCDVRLIGKDEHGSGWELSAKSTLCVFLLGGHIQHILRASQEIDWSTIYCECDTDIYPLIRKFVKA